MVHLHDGILCSRNKGAPNFATAWMELESIMLSEIRQVVRDKYLENVFLVVVHIMKVQRKHHRK